MRQLSLSGIVKRRFLYCVHYHGQPVRAIVQKINVPPGDLCRIIANQNISHISLETYYQIAQWLHMPLANALVLANITPRIDNLIRLGMAARSYNPSNTSDQIRAAEEAEISVAVFRRALHGYDSFRPSIRTCDRLAAWLAWGGFEIDDIALSAGMVICYRADGRRITLAPAMLQKIKPYPCACERPGCMVPAHIPYGPRRKWRSDACRMWAKRKSKREIRSGQRGKTVAYQAPPTLPRPTPIVRFIMINERPVPVRF